MRKNQWYSTESSHSLMRGRTKNEMPLGNSRTNFGKTPVHFIVDLAQLKTHFSGSLLTTVETRPAGAGAKAEAPVMAATARTRVNFILIFFVGLINFNNLDYVSREWAFGMHLSINQTIAAKKQPDDDSDGFYFVCYGTR